MNYTPYLFYNFLGPSFVIRAMHAFSPCYTYAESQENPDASTFSKLNNFKSRSSPIILCDSPGWSNAIQDRMYARSHVCLILAQSCGQTQPIEPLSNPNQFNNPILVKHLFPPGLSVQRRSSALRIYICRTEPST